jgi:ribonuclease HII
MIAGVDEAGRGPLAGPVVAAAVVLDASSVPAGLADSKRLSAAQRERLFEQIVEQAVCQAVGFASVEEIDRLNIFKATMLAMERAVAGLRLAPRAIVVDGKHTPRVACPAEAIVKGDTKVPAIMAASIIAKVTRDRVMAQLAVEFPVYGFDRHQGYPTAAHLAALRAHGPSDVHRRSFRPVRELLEAADGR